MQDDPSATKLEKYKISVDFLKFEATTLWQIFNAFFIGNNIFILVVVGLFRENADTPLLLLITGIVGLSIAILWRQTFRRNSHWYSFRMKQAKKAEAEYVNSIQDTEFYLLNNEAEKFAEGSDIRGIKNNHAALGMILIFILLYISLIIWAICQMALDANCN